MITIVVMIAPASFSAALADFFELLTALTRLLAVLAVFALRFVETLFRLADVLFALSPIVAVGTGRLRHSRQQRCTYDAAQNHSFKCSPYGHGYPPK
jgi:hypothetical protein